MTRITRSKPAPTLSQIVDQATNLIRTERKGALEYVPELAWMLFLRVMDAKESQRESWAEAMGIDYEPVIPFGYRWQDWAAPNSKKRDELTGAGSMSGAFIRFVGEKVFPDIIQFGREEDASPRRRVISTIFDLIGETKIRTEKTLLDALDIINSLQIQETDDFHLSEAYEALLLKLGEKNSDGGQFFTPRDVIRAIVKVVDPKVGETVYDPCAGTGGFLGIAYEHMLDVVGSDPDDVRKLKEDSFYAREMEDRAIPMGLANMALHGIDVPHLWHGNALTGEISSVSPLWDNAPEQFDVILTNPPFGGKETMLAQQRYAYKTKASQILFLQEIMNSLAPGGRCGMVIDEGVLFQTNQSAFVSVKKKLLSEFNLWCIVSLPGGVFSCAGAGVKTNLLFFNREGETKEIWYYDLSDEKIGKKKPLTLERMAGFLEAVENRTLTDRSWVVSIAEIEAKGYDLKAVNPNRKIQFDPRSSSEIFAEISERHLQITEALEKLRATLDPF